MAALLSHLQTSLLSPPEPAALSALLPLLALHQPFASAQAGPEASKFLRALDSLVVGKDEAGRLVGWSVAREVLEQEARGGQRARESGCIERYGRSWVTTLIGLAGQKKLPEILLHAYASLLSTVFLTASLSPQFQRESVLPALQKLVLALLSFFPPTAELSFAHLDAILPILGPLVSLHPASLRPLQGQLQTLSLRALTQPGATAANKRAAVNLFTALPALLGKSAMPQAFHVAILAALESAHQGVDSLFEGVIEEATRERDGEGLKFAPWDEVRREKDGWRRRASGKARVEAGVRLVAGLLRQATERAVPVPIGSVLALALRVFRVTSTTPLAHHASSEDVHLTLAVLPELHTLACALVGQLCLAVGPSMMPHMTELSSHLVYLLEQTTSSLVQTTLQQTLALLFENVGPWAPSREVSASLVERTAKASLRIVGGALLPSRESGEVDDPAVDSLEVHEGAGKGKGKKRAQDGTIGGNILATSALPLAAPVVSAVQAALSLLGLLLPHPALPVPAHVLATKVLLSVAFSLPHSAIVNGTTQQALEKAVAQLLAEGVESGPVAREGGVGPELGWVVSSIGSSSKTSDEVSRFLNPILPPTHQPLPSLESTLLYLPPGPTEAGMRIELGFATATDTVRLVSTETEDANMDVADAMAAPTPAAALLTSNFLAPVAPVPKIIDSAAAPDPFALPALAAIPTAEPTPVAPAAAPALPPLVAPPASVTSAPTASAAPALQPLPTATTSGVELASPAPSNPVTGGWQAMERDTEAEESDGEMPEIDMGDDTDDEDGE